MKILINLIGTGISNNGGSRTLIRSANILQKLGQDVVILNNKLNHVYNWDKIEVPILAPNVINNIPNADVVIGTGYGSWEKTIKLPNRCGKKFIWCRGWEIWQAPENKLIELLGHEKIKLIVNSICIQDKLKEFNIDSKIIRPGYDFDELKPLNIRQNKQGITIGGLYSKGDKRKSKRVEWIFEIVNRLKKDLNITLSMFGAEGAPSVKEPFNTFSSNPTFKTKNLIYNSCDIWLAPTCNDSLHLPPAEAMITECCIVGTNAKMNGMKDYLIGMETGIISKNTIDDFESSIRFIIDKPDLRLELGKNARKKILSLGSREENMNKLIKYLEDNML